MTKFSSLSQKLEVLPNTVKTLVGDFRPDVDSKVKRVEYKALMMISFDERKPMGFYCDRLDIENGSFTYLADKLEKKGWIVREYIQGDRRKKVLVLTSEGKRISDKIKEQFEAHVTKKLEVLSEEELENLNSITDYLDKIRRKIEKA